jgi:hypothetical protein
VLTAVSFSALCSERKVLEDEAKVCICKAHTAIPMALESVSEQVPSDVKPFLCIGMPLPMCKLSLTSYQRPFISNLSLTVNSAAPHYHASHSSLHFCQG